MNLLEALDEAPHLSSPAALAIADTNGKFQVPAHIAYINRLLVEVAFGEMERLIVNIPFQHGKALHVDTPIPTPTGWTRMGDLEVGDYVLSEEGLPCKVTAVSEVWKDRPVYKVTTDDGDEIIADEEHEWLVRLCNKGEKFSIKTTLELAKKRNRAPEVRATKPLRLSRKEFLVDPYVLGVWLGDGHTDESGITSADEEVIAAVAEKEGAVRRKSAGGGQGLANTYSFGKSFRDGAPREDTLQGRLRSLGVLGNKHIPIEYLRGSMEQRLCLLQGLIDSDGHVAPDGQVEFCSTNRRLADGTRELVASLGHKASLIEGRATLYGRDCGPKYRVMFYMENAARLSRKRERCRHGVKAFRRYLRAIPAGVGDTRCIQVDSPSHLFLCGKTMLPTHNSWICSVYFCAWLLLLFPDKRILLAAHEERFASSFGQKVKDVLERWGAPCGVVLRADSKAKNEWVIETHGGGMVCRGMHGSLQGRPADIFLLDDPLKDAEQAMSATVLEKQWDWYQTVAYSRLGPNAPIVLVSTRWCRGDLTGKILRESRETGEDWKVVKIPALALPGDVLGRPEGAPLWPERVPMKRLELIKKQRGRWFSACWQQEPEDEEGGHFKPRQWPSFTDLGDAYSLFDENKRRVIYLKSEVLRFATLDWAWSTKATADESAVGVFGLTPCGRILVLSVTHQRVRPEGLAPLLAEVCRKWSPRAVAAEVGHPLLADHYRKFPEIGEIHWLSTGGKDKLVRALPAILLGENRRILLPESKADWYEDFMMQVGSFTGINDDHDDMVDVVSYAATFATQLKPTLGTSILSSDPTAGLLVDGKTGW